MSLTISSLITNYNTWDLTLRCINALNYWSFNKLTNIIVVDDASTEETPSDIPKNINVITNQHNKGYVSSVNIGFSSLKEDIVLLLDSDAYPKHEMIDAIIQKFLEFPMLGALGFHLVDHQNKPSGSFHSEPTVMGLLLGQSLNARLNKYLGWLGSQSLCVFSCALAIRRTAFEEIGGFDEEFDFLDADIDFSIRLRKAGWDIQIDPNLIAYHEGGGSYQSTAKRVLRHHRNRWKLLNKHGHIRNPFLLKFLLASRHHIEILILNLLGSKLFTDSEVLSDKIYSRQELINNVWSAYGNDLQE